MTSFSDLIKKNKVYSAVMFVVFVCSCQNYQPKSDLKVVNSRSGLNLNQMIAENNKGEINNRIIAGIEHIREGNFQEATRDFNIVLVDDPLNSAVHALNGYAYHMMGKQGDVSKMDIAIAGYTQALNIDRDNTFAAAQLGHIHAEKREFNEAQEQYSRVLLEEPDNHEIHYELSAVSYQNGDLKTAKASIDQALSFDATKKEYLRAGAMIYAALGQKVQSNQFFDAYAKMENNPRQRHIVRKRIEDWHHLYATKGIDVPQEFSHSATMLLTSLDGSSKTPGLKEGSAEKSEQEGGTPPPEGMAQVPSESSEGESLSRVTRTSSNDESVPLVPQAPKLKDHINKDDQATSPDRVDVVENTLEDHDDDNDMVVIDVVVMRVSEEGSTQKGNNILENFTLTLSPFNYYRGRFSDGGISTGNVPGVGGDGVNIAPNVQGIAPRDPMNKKGLTVANVISQALSFGNVQYSLNIANARQNYIEVMGRPTLTTRLGQEAEFFSGENRKNVVSGQFGGNVVDTPYGFKLIVTPVKLKNDTIELKTRVEGSSFLRNDVLSEGRENETFTLLQSHIDTGVKMRLGETLILGGISERTEESSKSGFPILQDIPGLQYFFSQETTLSERRSIVYMITPRPYRQNHREVRRWFASDGRFGSRPNLTALEKRHKDWFDPGNTQIAILDKLGPVYGEFRTGDLTPLRWSFRDDAETKLVQAVEFLWY